MSSLEKAFEAAAREAVTSGGVVLTGATGVGKTTRFPLALAQHLEEVGREGKIYVLEPRRIAARGAAMYVNSLVSDIAGYIHRFARVVPTGAKIIYITTGSFLTEIRQNPTLFGCAAVIVDEAHERTVESDLSLALLRALKARGYFPDLIIGVMSATITTPDLFTKYLGVKHVHAGHVDTIRPVRDGEDVLWNGTKHVSVRYCPDWDIVSAIREVIVSQPPDMNGGTILVFRAGKEEIYQTIGTIKGAVARGDLQDMQVLPLHAGLSPQEQDAVFQPPDGWRVVVSTNIAEASVTLNRVVGVVDCGREKVLRVKESGFEVLEKTLISQSSAIQRAGRAGRTRDTGNPMVVRLYSRDQFNSFPPTREPEIVRVSPERAALAIASVCDAVGMAIEEVMPHFLTQPNKERWDEAISNLKVMGALDDSLHLTETGWAMSRLPIDPAYARAIIEALQTKRKAVVDITIRAMVAAHLGGRFAFFWAPGKERLKSDPSLSVKVQTAHAPYRRFAMEKRGDLFGLGLIIKEAIQLAEKEQSTKHDGQKLFGATKRAIFQFAQERYLKHQTIVEAVLVTEQIMGLLESDFKDLEPSKEETDEDYDEARRCIARGLIHRLWWCSGIGSFTNAQGVWASLGKMSPLDALPPASITFVVATTMRTIRTSRGRELSLIDDCVAVDTHHILTGIEGMPVKVTPCRVARYNPTSGKYLIEIDVAPPNSYSFRVNASVKSDHVAHLGLQRVVVEYMAETATYGYISYEYPEETRAAISQTNDFLREVYYQLTKDLGTLPTPLPASSQEWLREVYMATLKGYQALDKVGNEFSALVMEYLKERLGAAVEPYLE